MREDAPGPPERADARPDPPLAPSPPAEEIGSAQEWLIAELRDECSDIGVSARGFDPEGFARGVRAFAREARRLGAPAARMLVLLKQCLADQRISPADREVYLQYREAATTTAISTYYEPTGRADAPEPDARPG